MKNEFLNKKNELVGIIITTVLITFCINILSTIGFLNIDKSDHTVLAIIFILLLLFLLVFLYAIITANLKSLEVKVKIPIPFSRTQLKFYGLPFNPLSVHTKINFASLSTAQKKEIARDDTFSRFFNSELEILLYNSVQEFVIFYIINKTDFLNRDKSFISYENLPYQLKDNPFLEFWEMKNIEKKDYKIFVPAIKKIEVFGYNQSNLKLITEYGEIKISWSIAYHQLPNFSEPFIDDEKLIPLEDYHDFNIILKLEVNVPEKKIFKKELKEYMNWVEQVEMKISELNWENNNSTRMINLISDIKKSLRTTAVN